MGVDHLDQVMRIKSCLSSGKEVKLDAVYSCWVSHKNRREKSTADGAETLF